tara:strand:+ start:114 stop:494 length:381 start_codon:yes stop_codon:yes gene_type:complete
MAEILCNKMRTPDGTILHSVHRHDYVTHTDANGKEYMLDGGLSYVRRSANGDEEMLTVFDDAPHEILRDCVEWGTYGPEGNQPLTYIKISEMSSEHLRKCVFARGMQIRASIKQTMRNELEYRNES